MDALSTSQGSAVTEPAFVPGIKLVEVLIASFLGGFPGVDFTMDSAGYV
jgi:hypothetical protein